MRKTSIVAVLAALILTLAGCARVQGTVTGVEYKPDTITGKNWTYLTVTLKDGSVTQEIYTDAADVHRCVVGADWPTCVDNPVKPS